MSDGAVARPVALPDAREAAFVYAETVRPRLPKAEDTFADNLRLGEALKATRPHGFAGACIDDHGRLLTPTWVDARDFALVGSDGAVAVAGPMAHAAFRLPTAYDLGARDGRNVIDWGEDDWGDQPRGLIHPSSNLFLGDTTAQWLEMTQVGGRVNALDTSPDGAIIAVHEFWGSNTHGVSLVDAVTGERRLLTRLESLGLGDVRFSPDGAWLIVGTFLVEVATGRHLRLDTGLSSGQAAWWHARSPSALMLLDARAPGDLVVMAFDLATGAAELIGPITVPGTEELQDHHAFVKGLDVSADGRHALCGTSFGVSRAAWDAGWTGDRVSLIDVETRRLDVLVSPSLDGEMALERDHTRFRWLHRPSGTPVVLAPQLREQLSPPANTLGAENSDYVAGNARDVIVYGLNTMLGDAPAASDPHRLRPEVLRSLEALARFQPDGEYMNELREWIDAVSVHLLPLCRAGRLSSDVADGWLKFCEGWERIKNPGRGSISWASDRYLPAPRQTSPQLAAQPEPVAHSERPGIMPRIGQALESVELELPVDELDSFRQATTRLRGGDERPALTGIAYHGQRRTYYVVTERGLHYRHCARRAGLQAGRVIEPRKDDEHGAHRLDRQGLDQSSQDEVPQVQHGLLSQRQGRAGGRRLQEPELQRRAALPRLAQSLMPPLRQTP